MKELIEADSFKIEMKDPYSPVYMTCIDQAKKDLRAGARPELVSMPESIDEYDTIVLAYPNWWNTLPMPVLGFIERYDWNGKRIIPVNTSEGSGAGQSVQKIREVCRGAEVEAPYELIGSQVDSRIEEIRTWAKGKSET